MNRIETTACSGGSCIQVEDIGGDWFRVRSTANGRVNIAVTGAELRAFVTQVCAGQFHEIAGLEPDRTVPDLVAERDYLADRVLELEQGTAA
jgi:hypothetical protein